MTDFLKEALVTYVRGIDILLLSYPKKCNGKHYFTKIGIQIFCQKNEKFPIEQANSTNYESLWPKIMHGTYPEIGDVNF